MSPPSFAPEKNPNRPPETYIGRPRFTSFSIRNQRKTGTRNPTAVKKRPRTGICPARAYRPTAPLIFDTGKPRPGPRAHPVCAGERIGRIARAFYEYARRRVTGGGGPIDSAPDGRTGVWRVGRTAACVVSEKSMGAARGVSRGSIGERNSKNRIFGEKERAPVRSQHPVSGLVSFGARARASGGRRGGRFTDGSRIGCAPVYVAAREGRPSPGVAQRFSTPETDGTSVWVFPQRKRRVRDPAAGGERAPRRGQAIRGRRLRFRGATLPPLTTLTTPPRLTTVARIHAHTHARVSIGRTVRRRRSCPLVRARRRRPIRVAVR